MTISRLLNTMTLISRELVFMHTVAILTVFPSALSTGSSPAASTPSPVTPAAPELTVLEEFNMFQHQEVPTILPDCIDTTLLQVPNVTQGQDYQLLQVEAEEGQRYTEKRKKKELVFEDGSSARSLSHELRTPMQGVVGMLDVMMANVKDAAEGLNDVRMRRVLATLKENIEAVQGPSHPCLLQQLARV